MTTVAISHVQPKHQRLQIPPTSSWRCGLEGGTFGLDWHTHPEIELSLITSGSGQRLVGDSIGTYSPGDLLLIGSELPHTFVSPSHTTDNFAVAAQFNRDFAGPDFLKMPEFQKVSDLLDRADRGLAFPPDVVALVSDEIRAFKFMDDADRTLGLIHVLLVLARSATSARILSTSKPQQAPSSVTRTRINDVCRYLNNMYAEPVSLDAIASIAHMSPAAFSRFFHQTLGRTVTAYITELRIAAACRLLINTDLPVGEIAVESGYNNLSNFNRRFRAAKLMTPSEYRATFQWSR